MTRAMIGLAAVGCALGLAPATRVSAQKAAVAPAVVWAVEARPASNDFHEAVVVKRLVVVGTDQGELRAFHTGTGQEAWNLDLKARLYTRPGTDGERVFFAGAQAVHAVLADDGSGVWRFPLAFDDGPVHFTRAAGLVVAADADGTLYGLDAKTGAKKWSADFLADAPPDPPGFPGARARFGNIAARPSDLAGDGDAVFLSVFDQSRVAAFAAATGKRLWSFQTGGWVSGTPVATPTRVFVGSQDKYFYALDRTTGKQAWRFATGWRVSSGGAVDDTYVYFGSCDGKVYCLSQADGTKRWEFEVDRTTDGKRSPIYSVPVLDNGTVCIAAGEGQVYGLAQETGALRWKLRPEANSDLYCSPVTDGRSYFVTTRQRFTSPDQPRLGKSALFAVGLR